MEVLGNRIELAEQFSKAGYRPELAEAVRHEYKAASEGCNIQTIARVDGQPFWVDLYFNFYRGGKIEIRGICATLTKQERWLEFQGLPDAREVHRQLLEHQQKQEAKIYPLQHKSNEMNENNLAYNKNLLEKLGFGKALHDPLEKFIIQQQPE